MISQPLYMDIEKRKQQRHSREESVFVEVLGATVDSVDDNRQLECTTKDISKDGLKVFSSSLLPTEAIFELIISFESGGYKFLLAGEVKWVEKIGASEFLTGFEIVPSEHSDLIEWQNMFVD